MPDDIFGIPLPEKDRKSRKRQLLDHELRKENARIADCLAFPTTYELAEFLPPAASTGCPPGYPPLVYLLLASLMPVTGSKRSAVAAMASPSDWRRVRAAIRQNVGRRAAAQLPLNPPTRKQYQYAEANLLGPSADALHEAFERHALQQALAQGLFPDTTSRNWSHPQRCQLMVGDATVPKAPSKYEHACIEDPATGEILTHRVDPAARIYYENGEKAKTVARGTKWFFASARDDGYFRRVILRVHHVAGKGYEDEAAVAVRAFQRLKLHLPGCMGVVYDGAFRGVHRDALARQGLLVINKQHGSVKPRAYELLRPGRCRHDLWCDQGRIAERVPLDDGTSELIPVPILRLEHRAGTRKSRWYHLLRIPCRHGAHDYRVPVGITTTPEDRGGLNPATGRRHPSDAERDFHRAEHLQQIPEPTRVHQDVYPYRSDAESLHNQLDQSLWNGRMISYGLARQNIYLLGFALSQNATSHRVHSECRARDALFTEST
ncbi:hypothetical protein [Streptomyces sp. NPDC001770]